MTERLLRAGVAVYRAIDATPPWAWTLLGAAGAVGILAVIS